MKTSFSICKILFTLLTTLCIYTNIHAQPNIQHSIYFQEKHCLDSFFVRPFYTLEHSKGSRFMIYVDRTPDSLNQYSESVRFAKLKSNSWDTLWTKLYNGPDEDILKFIKELPNGNLLLAGHTSSDDGGILYGYPFKSREIWLMEVDTFGTRIKTKCIGGGNGSELVDLSISTDGFIYFAGNTIANDYDFAHLALGGWGAAWIAKYDTAFNKVWIKVIDGDGEEGWPSIKEVTPERFVISFLSNSTDTSSVPLEAKGMVDVIVHYIDSSGNIIWKHRYGGANDDGTSGLSVVDPISKDIYFINRSNSFVTGDITHWSGTCWILKIDTFGNIKGSKSYGAATNTTWMNDAVWYENKLWVIANSTGGGGDMEPADQVATTNAWIGVFDSSTNLVAKYTLRTKYSDYFTDAFFYKNELFLNGLILSDTVHAFSCDTSNKAMGFVVKPGLSPLGIIDIRPSAESIFDVYPIPTSQNLFLNISSQYHGDHAELKVYNVDGTVVYKKKIKAINQKEEIECSNWKSGNYVVQLTINKKITASKQFIKQ
jgi:hypothetical protein